MAGAKNHQYHILPPSIWPFLGSFSALAMAVGAIMWMHSNPSGSYVFFAGLLAVLFVMFSWWVDVIREAHAGDHTPIVQLHLRYGMILFIASEVMFFVPGSGPISPPRSSPRRSRASAAPGRRRA
jgi:cytochrome c oxidase subunit 3